MTWWAWLLVFVLLVVLAAVVLFLLVRSVWRKASALFTELAHSSDRIAELTAVLESAERPGIVPGGAPAV